MLEESCSDEYSRAICMDPVKRATRRIHFSLRTLLCAVAVIGIGLGWVVAQLNWIRQRHAILDADRVQRCSLVLLMENKKLRHLEIKSVQSMARTWFDFKKSSQVTGAGRCAAPW